MLAGARRGRPERRRSSTPLHASYGKRTNFGETPVEVGFQPPNSLDERRVGGKEVQEGVCRPLPKNMWLTSSACGLRIREPAASPPIFFNAPPIPPG